MSDAPQAQSPQKVAQFLQLLPMTMAIAGLPFAEHGKYFNEDQMEIRARTLRTAYKHAKLLAKEIAQEQG
jgi:hypothetical protein